MLQLGCFECDDWNHVPALPSWNNRNLTWRNLKTADPRSWSGGGILLEVVWPFNTNAAFWCILATTSWIPNVSPQSSSVYNNGCSIEIANPGSSDFNTWLTRLLTNLLFLKPGDHQKQCSCLTSLGPMLHILEPSWEWIHAATSTSKGPVDMSPFSLQLFPKCPMHAEFIRWTQKCLARGAEEVSSWK